MKLPRYWLRFLIAYFIRFKGLLLGGVVVGIVIFLVSSFIAPRFLFEKTVSIGLTGRFTPENLPQNISENIAEGLTKMSEEGVVEPSMASHWETPDKGKTWVFYLRDDIAWQDGKKVVSKDLNYQFSDVEIERPDDLTIVFKLKDSFSPFPSVVSRPVFKSGFLGTGEWRVTDAALAGNFVQSLTLQKAGEGKKIYKFYPSEDRTKLAFKMGHVDQVSEIIEPNPLNKWETVKIEKNVKKSQVVTIFFNNEDNLFKDNKELRQALNYSLDKTKYEGERAISPIPPNSWVYNPQVKPYNLSLERAKEILGENGKDIQIKLVTSPVLLSVAELIAEDWKQIGINTTVQISSVIPTDFQAYLAILDVPRDPDQYSIWHSTQKDFTNVSKFTNPRIDKLLEDGRIELNSEIRRNIYLDFQRFIGEELPAAFLYHPVTYTVTRQ